MSALHVKALDVKRSHLTGVDHYQKNQLYSAQFFGVHDYSSGSWSCCSPPEQVSSSFCPGLLTETKRGERTEPPGHSDELSQKLLLQSLQGHREVNDLGTMGVVFGRQGGEGICI